MKCIRCNQDAKYRDRSEGKCPSCGERFAFEPRNGDAFTDAAFNRSIELVSGNGKVRWTIEHLRYELARRKGASIAFLIFVCCFGAVFVLLGLVIKGKGAIAVPLLGLVFVLFGVLKIVQLKTRPRLLSKADFEALWRRWLVAHGTPPSLIVRKASPARVPPAEIAEYSFDRAVVCDREETVDLLLANNFHFENNCAVLSADGYPPHAFKTVRAMLKKNPRLCVFVLHDASIAGCVLAKQVAESSEWFPGALVIDVGLRPCHTLSLAYAYQAATPGAALPHTAITSDDEPSWLDKHSCELFALRPEQTIKRLYKAMANAPDLSLGEHANIAAAALAAGLLAHGAFYVDRRSFAARALAADGGGDSFG